MKNLRDYLGIKDTFTEDLHEGLLEEIQENPENPENPKTPETPEELWETLDPETGVRYDIPLLDTADGAYYWKYINFMKIRKQNPDTFNKILGWN